jgi:large subunit ribosomal protein L25
MADLTLTAETGRPRGSRASNRLRNAGKVPAVVYGHGQEPVPVTVDWRALRAALTTDAGVNALLTLHVDGEETLALVRELQRDPIKRRVDHVDFIRVSRDEAITVEVPIHLHGEAEAVLREDGMVEQALNALVVHTKPTNIPNELVVDISEMTIGDSIRVSDIRLPEGVTTDVDPDEAVATALVTRATIEAEEAAEAAEGEAIGEAEAAEGGEAAAAGEEGANEDTGAAAAEGDAE